MFQIEILRIYNERLKTSPHFTLDKNSKMENWTGKVFLYDIPSKYFRISRAVFNLNFYHFRLKTFPRIWGTHTLYIHNILVEQKKPFKNKKTENSKHCYKLYKSLFHE